MRFSPLAPIAKPDIPTKRGYDDALRRPPIAAAVRRRSPQLLLGASERADPYRTITDLTQDGVRVPLAHHGPAPKWVFHCHQVNHLPTVATREEFVR